MSISTWRDYAVDALRSYFYREWREAAELNSQFVPPFARRHLKKVYFSLFCASASSAVGCYLGSILHIRHLYAVFATFLSFSCLYFVPQWRENQRLCFFIAAAFFGGVSLIPWISLHFVSDAGFVVTSLLAVCVGFGCFWAVTKWTESFSLIFLRALLLCCPLVLACLLIASAVFGGQTAHLICQILLYVETLGFMVYVATYSQEAALKARRGDSDFVKHAIRLFTDFPPAVLNVPWFLKHTWRIGRRRRYTPN